MAPHLSQVIRVMSGTGLEVTCRVSPCEGVHPGVSPEKPGVVNYLML